MKKYLQTVNMSVNNMINLSINQIKSKINKWDNDKWVQNMETKSTLDIHRSHKKVIEEERWFRNGIKYNIMIKARSNTLKLGWREWTVQENKICQQCKIEIESLEHFILMCTKLQHLRNKYIQLQLPMNENKLVILSEI